MLTRLKVSGFKNLVDVDVRFGPFTCIAGANGVGKSNLFDAINFLSLLADHSFIEAALSVRDEGGRTADVRTLFHRVVNRYDDEMSFEVEMLVPKHGSDHLGQEAEARTTFLRYKLVLAYSVNENLPSLGSFELRHEELGYINITEAGQHLPFPHSMAWRKSAVQGRRTAPFISTDVAEDGRRVIKRRQDGSGGVPQSYAAADIPQTVLSTVDAAQAPTALLARREMQSWRLVQLEPSSLREPDKFIAQARLGEDGKHLPASLYYLARANRSTPRNGDSPHEESPDELEAQVYAEVANQLSQLIDDVFEVRVDRDDRQELLTLHVRDRGGTDHPARALSDGTLRFLALAVLRLEPESQGLICLEEPENGIHPGRIPAMLGLLQSIATNVERPIGSDNPLRQVIVNTHSPAVVQQVPDDSLVVAEPRQTIGADGRRFMRVDFGGLEGTWREQAAGSRGISLGVLLDYLQPVRPQDEDGTPPHFGAPDRTNKTRRVADRPEIQPLLFSVSFHEGA